MIGLVMAGGKGSRMLIPKEKLLLEFEKPVILHVIDAMKESMCFSEIIAVTSSNSPNTEHLLQKNNVTIFHSSGSGYVDDLNNALQSIDDSVFVTSGDMPLLDKEIIQTIVSKYNPKNTWISFIVTQDFLKSLKMSGEYKVNFNKLLCYYTGISLVNAANISTLKEITEDFVILNDKRIGLNLNTKEDYDLLRTT